MYRAAGSGTIIIGFSRLGRHRFRPRRKPRQSDARHQIYDIVQFLFPTRVRTRRAVGPHGEELRISPRIAQVH